MASTYSTRLRLELQTTGENRSTWGTLANNVFQRIEDAIAGSVSVAMGDANVTLTTNNGTSDQARNMIVVLTGSNTATRTVTIPAVSKVYFFVNDTGQSVIISNGSNSITITNGTRQFVITNGTLMYADGPSAITASTVDVSGDINLAGNLVMDGGNKDILADVADDRILISGSSTSNTGANLVLWGSSHATEPNNMWLRTGTTQILKWDDTNTRFDFLSKVRVIDSVDLAIGTGEDLTINHNGTNTFITNSTGSLFIDDDQNAGTGLIALRKVDSGNTLRDCIQVVGTTPAVNLYHSGNLRLQTTANGINVTNPNTPRITLNDETATNAGIDARVQFLYNSTQGGYIGFPNVDDYYVQNNLPSGNMYLGCDNSAGIIYLRPNANNEAARADSVGLLLLDDKRIDFGASRDLRIFHSSDNQSYIDSHTGHLYLRNRSNSSTNGIYIQDLDAGGNNHTCAVFEHDQVLLYFDNSSRLQTTSAGVTINGALTATGNVTAFSDERVKENWRSLPDSFLEEIVKIKHGTYDRMDIDARHVGVSAQDLRKVLPETVEENPDGELSVAYGNAAMAVALELADKVLRLEKRVEELSQ